MDRRTFLRATGAGALVVGFDTATGGWVHAASAGPGDSPLPRLDGVVVMDDASLEATSTDAGNLVTARPWAVLRPGSARDVARMVGYCRSHRIPVAARGQAHSSFGQGLVEGGLIVEMSWLGEIHSIGGDTVLVDGGVTWKQVVEAAVPLGLTPPVLTGFLALSVGGTLSMGGISTRPDQGVQVDRVRRLDVVTGTGDLVTCSAETNADLFHGVLAGVGQLGIITAAELELVPAPDEVSHWTLNYSDPSAWMSDLWMLLGRGEAESVYATVAPLGAPTSLPQPPASVIAALGPLAPALNLGTDLLADPLGLVSRLLGALPGQWLFQLNVGKFHATGNAPRPGDLLRGTSDLALLRYPSRQSYLDFALRVDVLVDLLKTAGLWEGVQHPWFDVFLEGDVTEAYVTDVMADLSFDDVGLVGFVLLFPILRSQLTRPNLRVPPGDSEYVCLFDILASGAAPGADPEWAGRIQARNRRLYEQAAALGGTLYPIGSTPMTQADWAAQYGADWPAAMARKAHYDPEHILAPGVGIFG